MMQIKMLGVRALSVLATAGVLSVTGYAQDAAAPVDPAAIKAPTIVKTVPVKPAPAKVAPAIPDTAATAKTTPAATAKTAATPAEQASPTAAATTAKPKPVVKKVAAPSPCQGLDQTACGGNKVCAWIVPKDANDTTGKVQEPYCRKVAGVAAQKPVAPKPLNTAAPAQTGTQPDPSADQAAKKSAVKKAGEQAKKVEGASSEPAVTPAAKTKAQVVAKKVPKAAADTDVLPWAPSAPGPAKTKPAPTPAQ